MDFRILVINVEYQVDIRFIFSDIMVYKYNTNLHYIFVSKCKLDYKLQ